MLQALGVGGRGRDAVPPSGGSVMDHLLYQYLVLDLLGQEWDTNGPPGRMDIKTVLERVPLRGEDVMRAIEVLFEDGNIDFNETRTAVFLTPQGYERGRRDDKEVGL